MIHVTFPDGASRVYEPGVTGLEIAKSISPSLAKRTVAMVVDGALTDLADPVAGGRQSRVHQPRRSAGAGAHSPRRGACARRGGAVAVARDAGDHRAGDRERLLLRLLPQRRRSRRKTFRRSRRRCARSSRADKPFVKRVVSREEAKSYFEKQGEAFKIELIDAIPADQDLKLYSQGEWTDLCRGPHMTSTGKIGDAFKLMKVAGAYWRGDSTKPMLSRIYATAFAKKEELDAYLKQLEEAEQPRPPQTGARDGPVPFPGGRAGHGVLASQGLDAVPDADRLHAPPPRRRLPGSQRAAGARQAPVGDLRPLGLVSRKHVHGARRRRRGQDRGRAHLRASSR